MGYEPSCVNRVHHPPKGTRKLWGGIDMMRKVTLLLVLIVGIASVPALTVHAATTPFNLAKALQQVDQLLDRARRNLAAADELVEKKQMAAKDQAVDRAMRLTREAERKIESALAMVRALGSTRPSKEPLPQVDPVLPYLAGRNSCELLRSRTRSTSPSRMVTTRWACPAISWS